MENLKIRKSLKEDNDWLWSLYCSTMKVHIERTWGWDEKSQIKSFNKHLPFDKFQIIYQNRIDIGAYLLKDKINHFWLEIILIDPKYQNIGIGSNVINDILEKKCTSDKPLKFNVIKGNPALKLYKRLGFCIYEEDDNFYKLTSAYNNSMQWEFKRPSDF